MSLISCCKRSPAGTRIKNKDYSRTLNRLESRGAKDFYTGRIGRDIVHAVQSDPAIAGDMTLEEAEALPGYQGIAP